MKYDIHSYPTRHNYFIQKPKVRLTKTSRWFDNLAVDMFNKLPYEAHVIPYQIFKSALRKWRAMNPFYKVNEYFDTSIYIPF